MQCDKCGKENSVNAVFCVDCGNEIASQDKVFCSNCGAELKNGTFFCGKCGMTIDGKTCKEPYTPPVPKKKSPVAIIITVLILIIALLSACIVGYFLIDTNFFGDQEENVVSTSHKNKKDSSSKETKQKKNDYTVDLEEIEDTEPDFVEENEESVAERTVVTDVEGKVETIRTWYNQTQNALDSYTISTSEGVKNYYDDNGDIVRIDFAADEFSEYTRCYYFKNGEMYFAFIFNGTRENRLYFDNGQLFRWIDEHKTIHDNAIENEEFISWEMFAQTDVARY